MQNQGMHTDCVLSHCNHEPDGILSVNCACLGSGGGDFFCKKQKKEIVGCVVVVFRATHMAANA